MFAQSRDLIDAEGAPFDDSSGERGCDDELNRWSLRIVSGIATNSALEQIFEGRPERLHETKVSGVEVGRVLRREVNELPLEISANFGLLYHESDFDPSGVFQYNVYLKAEWTAFPWDDFLRTKIGLGEGLSYVNEITYSEEVRRMGKGSKKLLNYLDFSLSLNVADLGHLLMMDRLIGNDLQVFDDTWFVANISHRSGGYGLFGNSRGDDGNFYPAAGGDNVITFGIKHRF
jgi:MipA family protein